LCHGTGSLFAPAGGTAADAQMHLTAKITGRKGIHMLQADRFRLLLVPTTEVPTSGTTLTWVPAAALIGAPTEELVLPLSTVLASAASQLLLQRLATAVTASSASKKAAAEDEAYVVAIDPGVPRRLATDLFLGETAAAANKELLSMLGIVHVLLFASGMAAEQPKADQTHNGESSGGSASVEAATSVAASIGATLTVVDLGVCGDAARAGDTAVLEALLAHAGRGEAEQFRIARALQRGHLALQDGNPGSIFCWDWSATMARVDALLEYAQRCLLALKRRIYRPKPVQGASHVAFFHRHL